MVLIRVIVDLFSFQRLGTALARPERTTAV